MKIYLDGVSVSDSVSVSHSVLHSVLQRLSVVISISVSCVALYAVQRSCIVKRETERIFLTLIIAVVFIFASVSLSNMNDFVSDSIARLC